MGVGGRDRECKQLLEQCPYPRNDKRKCGVGRRHGDALGLELVEFIYQYAFNLRNMQSFILTVGIKDDFLYIRAYKS